MSVDDLAGYVDGVLGPDERARVRGHVDGCERCSLVLRRVEETRKLVPRRE